MAGLVALVCPRTGSRSTLFASRTDWWRSTGTSLRTRPRGKSQPAAFQCSERRFPPDDRFRKAVTMKDAKTLLLEFLAAVTHGQDAAAQFAEDGALELPFLHSLGIPWRPLHHMFAARLVAENGLIKLVRESLNVVAAAQALLPGGVKDLTNPEKVIFSVPPDYRS